MTGSPKSSSLSQSASGGASSSSPSSSSAAPPEACGTCGWERGPFGQWTQWDFIYSACDPGCGCVEPDWEPDPPGPTTAFTNCYPL